MNPGINTDFSKSGVVNPELTPALWRHLRPRKGQSRGTHGWVAAALSFAKALFALAVDVLYMVRIEGLMSFS